MKRGRCCTLLQFTLFIVYYYVVSVLNLKPLNFLKTLKFRDHCVAKHLGEFVTLERQVAKTLGAAKSTVCYVLKNEISGKLNDRKSFGRSRKTT